MKKFMKRMLIAAGCFFTAGLVLGTIGAVGGNYMNKKSGNTEDFSMVRETWNRLRKWDFRRIRGGGQGFVLTYDGTEFDEGHDIVYGSFTDDNLRDTDIHNLKLEIGGGSLTICQGDHMELKKDGGPECQYYMEGDTFYLKQKLPVGGGASDLVLTVPEEIDLEEVDIIMGAGEVAAGDVLAAEKVKIEIDAGEIVMEEVKAESFQADMAAGSITVYKLDTKDCDVTVNMGNITLRDGLVSGNLDAEVDMGEISVFLRDSYEDHDYEVDCSMGEVAITDENGNTKEYAGLGRTMELSGNHATGESRYDLTCSMGSIFISFSGKDTMAGEGSVGTGDGIKEMEEGLQEVGRDLPDLENDGIYGLEDYWPETIGHENQNTTAQNFSFEIDISEPMTLLVSCYTESGDLEIRIDNERGKEVFKKKDIRTGTYEVDAESAGTYTVHLDCENHTGSFWIQPKK